MKPMLRIALLAALLVGCSNSPTSTVAGGGFETSDVAVGVSLSSGQKAAYAEVWLVQYLNDSIPAKVIDSAMTDSTGVVHLQKPDTLRHYGVECLQHGMMGLVYDSGQGLNQLQLAPAALVSPISLYPSGKTPPDSSRRTFVLGSHFSAAATDTAPTLWVPHEKCQISIGGPPGQPPIMRTGSFDSTGQFVPGALVPRSPSDSGLPPSLS
jgi:hypothetical protein